MRIKDQIEEKLTRAFTPSSVEVFDESEAHRGHAGWRDGGQTHFRVKMRSAALEPLSRLERHRAVHDALTPALVGKIHALSLEINS